MGYISTRLRLAAVAAATLVLTACGAASSTGSGSTAPAAGSPASHSVSQTSAAQPASSALAASSSDSGWHQMPSPMSGEPTLEGKCQMEPSLHTQMGGPGFILTLRDQSGADTGVQEVTVAFNNAPSYGTAEFFPVQGQYSGYAQANGLNAISVRAGTTLTVVASSDPLYPSSTAPSTACWPTGYNEP